MKCITAPALASALMATTLMLGVCAEAGMADDLRVGHRVERMVVPGSFQGEPRQVDVQLWYPADQRGLSDAPRTIYTSALHGRSLIPGRWNPLSWRVEAEVARENAPIDPDGHAFPVIVFSHGSTNDPIDYAHTLELIAGAGFVVAAPAHVNNTQDDARIDFVNGQVGSELFPCNDGLHWTPQAPCATPSAARSMRDRARDIGMTLDKLPEWFGDRVDASRAGVLGHSRGTATALAAAGGAAPTIWPPPGPWPATPPAPGWGFGPLRDGAGNPRVKAVMGLTIGAPTIAFGADIEQIDVPSLLVAGALDQNPGGNVIPPYAAWKVSRRAFDMIGAPDKAFVLIRNATHRSFDSTYCAQVKAAGAATMAAGINDQLEPRAILDWHTAKVIAASLVGGISGKAHEYCSSDTFQDKAADFDITGLMSSLEPQFPQFTESDPTPTPTTGLDTDQVKETMTELAVTFFGTVLKRVGNDGPHFTRYLAPNWLEQHESMVACAEVRATDDAIFPAAQGGDCPN